MFGDEFVAAGVGVDLIGLVQAGVAADAFQEKREQGSALLRGDGGENFLERAREVAAHRGWHLHAGEDEFGGRAPGAHAREDLLEVGAGDVGADAAQAVVAAECEHEEIDGLAENPVDAAQAAGGGLAAETGVDDAPVEAGGVDLGLEEGGVGLRPGIGQAEARGEAVTEEHDGARFGGGDAARQDEAGRQKQETAEKTGDRLRHRLDFVGFVCFVSASMSERTMLKVERLTKTYQSAGGRDLTVLKEVSFALEAGATLAIVGPSGSGKTTLLGLCAGLDQPSGGRVELAGQSIGELSEDARALARNAHVGFVFQNFQLVPTLTALENVLVPVELRGEGGPAVEREAQGLLQRVGLGERCDHYPVQLSGGEQQRVALARAFMNRPKILFCDEPTGNLDGETAQAMVELIFGLNHERQTTLVLVTHDLELAKRCQRILRLKGGAVVSDERTNETADVR